MPRPDHQHPLPAGTTLVLFTDGLVEHSARPLDAGLAALARTAAAHAGTRLDDLCRTLADARISDGRDDLALLALRTPPRPHDPSATGIPQPG